jgi:hypothetical protein
MFDKGVVCFIICFGQIDGTERAAPTSDFCQRYERQVLNKEELAAMMALPRALRDRIQGNELDYLCECLGWKDKVCKSTTQ